ncbi:MAG TPA: 3-isopropylmalate dehydratase small subunit [Acidimicrobiia bacterium]|nr:3-isopropylmalate dehydratase small subunit [Acidimicrobiia bacterium]
MRRLQEITGTIAPLPRSNVDTDQIMPKQYLKRVERTGYGQFLFADWRKDSSFVLDKPEYRQAKVLVTGPNFGCGSSREHAPWGLQDWGFEAVIAPSFADIFHTNCTKIGLLPVELTEKECQYLIELAESDPTAEIDISLPEQTVSYRDQFEARFDIDPFVKSCLNEGLDDIGLTLRHETDIDSFEEQRPAWKPSLA